MQTLEKARFDAKLSKAQKDFFEYAANIGGYRSLTDFVVASVQEKANKIVEQNSKISLSKKGQQLFFNEIINPTKPNNALLNAVKIYNQTNDSK